MDAIISADHRQLIQASFNRVTPVSHVFVDLFYNRLFEVNPQLKSLFKTSIEDQGPKLVYMLALLVRGIDRLTELTPAIQELSKRHTQYGVKAQDYQTVGEALLWTLDHMLGEEFTPEIRAAWSELYTHLATICIEAAYP